MAKYNICTNFYSNYLYKGLSLYYSLERTSKNFCFWILCMDDETFNILSGLKLKNAKLVKIETLEDDRLLEAKKSRNKGEYSWTTKSCIISYLFEKYNDISSIFYLDADIFFYNDVGLVYEDIGNNSLAIAPHRFPKGTGARIKTSGAFNAGVIFVKRDNTGLKALNRWKKQCLEWCYQKPEAGKYGDQMYLDEWPKLYKNLHQFQHPGINLAPWNINTYKITNDRKELVVDGKPLVFYHFHELKIFSDLTFDHSSSYQISNTALDLIYKHYENSLLVLINKLDQTNPSLKLNLEKKDPVKVTIQKIKRFLLPVYWRITTLLSV